ncbi:hypothetical protein FRC02_001121 [Tulasnella sp. 418]|nr:hypothetical protein FRC02_001121 [Tulasnella sp. 418]
MTRCRLRVIAKASSLYQIDSALLYLLETGIGLARNWAVSHPGIWAGGWSSPMSPVTGHNAQFLSLHVPSLYVHHLDVMEQYVETICVVTDPILCSSSHDKT